MTLRSSSLLVVAALALSTPAWAQQYTWGPTGGDTDPTDSGTVPEGTETGDTSDTDDTDTNDTDDTDVADTDTDVDTDTDAPFDTGISGRLTAVDLAGERGGVNCRAGCASMGAVPTGVAVVALVTLAVARRRPTSVAG